MKWGSERIEESRQKYKTQQCVVNREVAMIIQKAYDGLYKRYRDWI